MLNIEDVAERLRVSVDDARNMRARDQLPKAIKFGRRLRWSEAEFDAWLKSRPRT